MADPRTPPKSAGTRLAPRQPTPRRGLAPVTASAAPRLGYGPERPPVRMPLKSGSASAAPPRSPAAHTPGKGQMPKPPLKPSGKARPVHPVHPVHPTKARPASAGMKSRVVTRSGTTKRVDPVRADAATEARYAGIRDRVKAKGGTVNEGFVRRTDAKNQRSLRDNAVGRKVSAARTEHRADMMPKPRKAPPRSSRRP